MPKGKTRVAAEEFCIAFDKAESPEEVAKKFGMTVPNVLIKASGYRRRGLDLKKFPGRRGPAPLDVAAINKLLKNPLSSTKVKAKKAKSKKAKAKA